MVFSEIEEAVLAGRADAGVLIHEGRFTFAQKGLTKIMDLGDFWEKQTNSPIPLGGIVVRNTLSSTIQRNLSRLIRQSVAYGMEHYPQLPAYVKDHAQEMDEAVMRQHINLYVNDFTLSLGDTGRNAISNFLHTYSKTHKVQIPTVTMVD